MKQFLKFFLFVCVLAGATPSQAQTTDMELAEYYFSQGEFESAKLYYEKIYKTNRTNRVFQNYLRTLTALGDLDSSEKLLKKKIKSSKRPAVLYVDLGQLYKSFDEIDKAEGAFKKAVSEMSGSRSETIKIANAFVKNSEFEQALSTYDRAKRLNKDGYTFDYEIANLQGNMGDHEGMVDSFLDLLRDSPNFIQTVQNSLNRNLDIQKNEERAEMFKGKLLKKTQSDPQVVIYNELLAWYFLQRKEFAAGFVQAKALDKRLEENGGRLMELAQLALNNKEYSTARKCYDYVVEKGAEGDYYSTARTELLRTSFKEIKEDPQPSSDDLGALAASYKAALAELGETAYTATMMKDLAHIQAFYLNDSESAKTVLNKAIEIPGLYPLVAAMLKLELGDVYLFTGEIWDASLLYSQVDLDFKEDQVGHEARYRNAKISFYTGDFDWAQAQLDVIKASTSKLISNDAIDLSLLITDNYALDTIQRPMLLFAEADLLAYQNRVPEALAKLDSITADYPGHALTDEILLLKSDIFSKRGEYEKSIPLLQQIIDLHFTDILADDAIFDLAEINEEYLEDLVKAQELYEKIILEYPGSLYAVDARKRFRRLRGDELE